MDARQLGLHVLIVEDDDDTRDLLTQFFAGLRYDVTAVATAEEGLERLSTQTFDLVVSDNQLNGAHTGSWMLQEADSAGLLRDVGALMYTGDSELAVPPSVRVLTKPTGLDDLQRAADEALANARRREMAVTQGELDQRESRPSMSSDWRCPVELTLYVTNSPSSLRAVRTLETALADYDDDSIRLHLCNLTNDSSAEEARADHVVFVPTLVKRSPGREARIIGDLGDGSAVKELLRDCGVDEHEARSGDGRSSGPPSRERRSVVARGRAT